MLSDELVSYQTKNKSSELELVDSDLDNIENDSEAK